MTLAPVPSVRWVSFLCPKWPNLLVEGELVCAIHGKALEDTRQRAQSTWPMAKCAVLSELKKEREWRQEWEWE